MTFATLRALHAVIGTAIDDIEHVYRERSQEEPMEFPSLDEPYYHSARHTPEEELAEALKDDPAVVTASMRVVAACAQLSATVNKPWLALMEDMLWVRTILCPVVCHRLTCAIHRPNFHPLSVSSKQPTSSRFYARLVLGDCTSGRSTAWSWTCVRT